jgi:hypothetical protein
MGTIRDAAGCGRPVTVEVDGERWLEVASLADAKPDDRVFTVDAGGAVVFGDGVRGRRLTPESAVVVTYRTGAGGNAEAGNGDEKARSRQVGGSRLAGTGDSR